MSALFVISELLMVTRWKAVFNATKRCVCQTLCRREARGRRGNLRQGKKCGSVFCCLSHSATTFSFNPQLVFVFWQGSICVCAALKAREITKYKKSRVNSLLCSARSSCSLWLDGTQRQPMTIADMAGDDGASKMWRMSADDWLWLHAAPRCHTVTAKKYKWAVG